jgi:hypothetical protein
MRICRRPRPVLLFCLLASAVVVHAQTRPAAQPTDEGPVTNTAVVKLVRAGFSEKTVIAIIRTRPVQFDLAPDHLIELKKRGVSEKVILAMLARDGGALPADDVAEDGFDTDPFFNDQTKSKQTVPGAGSNTSQSDPGAVNIFGSSGGMRGRSRTNGTNGGAAGETQTTGSASVHILRPPTEGGNGTPPKLERTPTLTNDAIVQLVEAGFSEGTIIRRIENSPADFDLSAAKLADLRRRRVTEPVINAMRAAMSDDSTAPTGNATDRPRK